MTARFHTHIKAHRPKIQTTARGSLQNKCFFSVYPFMIMASSVVSPFSSGLPPKPTLPSHCSASQRAQPCSTASNTEPPDCRQLHAADKATRAQRSANLEPTPWSCFHTRTVTHRLMWMKRAETHKSGIGYQTPVLKAQTFSNRPAVLPSH